MKSVSELVSQVSEIFVLFDVVICLKVCMDDSVVSIDDIGEIIVFDLGLIV